MAINGIEMVTDRSISDVEIAKSLIRKGLANMTESEKQQFLAGLKGAYNYTDFNRVESAVKYLATRLVNVSEELEEYLKDTGVATDDAFDVPYNKKSYENIKTKTNWEIFDLLTYVDIKRYIDNVLLILKSLSTSAPNVPNRLENLNHTGANNIEIALDKLNKDLTAFRENKRNLITNTSASWFFSGDLYGGEI